MSAVRLAKLKALLERVERRRGEPRLRAVPSAPKASPAQLVSTPEPTRTSRPAASLADAMAELSIDAPSMPSAPFPSLPEQRMDVPTLVPTGSMPATRRASLPEEAPVREEVSVDLDDNVRTLPPAARPPAAHEPEPDSREEEAPRPSVRESGRVPAPDVAPAVLEEPSAVMQPAPVELLESAVKTASAMPVKTPSTFGELLSLSLELRPRSSS